MTIDDFFNRTGCPDQRQLRWHRHRFYALIHFGINTFTDSEWGFGDQAASCFNPTDFDTGQIVRSCREAGMAGCILTCKHHDGFCLWPTRTTAYSVRNSPWRHGEGDVVREVMEACRREGLLFGVYLSPWDRNAASYGTPEYLDMYRRQLTELLTGYGEIFEVWFDGANGGDGFYGGGSSTRTIDRRSYYPWPEIWELVRRLQPQAAIFSDLGPDCRWIGNEAGIAAESCWATYTPRSNTPGLPAAIGESCYTEAETGHPESRQWLPGECDVPLRKGWFFHPRETAFVKSAPELLELYLKSVGRGCNLSLGLAPDRRGQLPEPDVTHLRQLGNLLRSLWDITPLPLPASHGAEITVELPETRPCNVIHLSEDVTRGQRIRRGHVEVRVAGEWRHFADFTSVGIRRILTGEKLPVEALRVVISAAEFPVQLTGLAVAVLPELPPPPSMLRHADGQVELQAREGLEIHYTLDGSDPAQYGQRYHAPLPLPAAGLLRAVTRTREGAVSWPVTVPFDAVYPDARVEGYPAELLNAADGRSWRLPNPAHIRVHFDTPRRIEGFSLLPTAQAPENVPDHYEFRIDGRRILAGEFSNIHANPTRQELRHAPQEGCCFEWLLDNRNDPARPVEIDKIGLL